jgi:hypothetical protein
MENLEDLILYENENVRLDFKIEEYRKGQYSTFLKDIISMANAFTLDDRYIIIGLKPKSNENRGFCGINGDLTDSATYQQIVFENIEPELSIDYFPFCFKDYIFGVFRISSCENPPYLMKKDFGDGKNRLNKGDGFIRKGSHQTRLSRTDYDEFDQRRKNKDFFNEELAFYLDVSGVKNEILLKTRDELKWPSQIIKKKIEKIIEIKRQRKNELNKLLIQDFDFDSLENQMAYANAAIKGTSVPYENRSIATLEKDLLNVEKTYERYDNYVILEKQSSKCNIIIFNKGNKYIEDASIIVKIPKIEGLFISERIYPNPDSNLEKVSNSIYPKVAKDNKYYIIKYSIGNIKHQINQEAFQTPLRILAIDKIAVESLKFQIELFAKNIKTSITKEITINFSMSTKGGNE